MTTHKRKKSLVGYTNKNWIDGFYMALNDRINLNFPCIYEYKRYDDNIKVRITLEEI